MSSVVCHAKTAPDRQALLQGLDVTAIFAYLGCIAIVHLTATSLLGVRSENAIIRTTVPASTIDLVNFIDEDWWAISYEVVSMLGDLCAYSLFTKERNVINAVSGAQRSPDHREFSQSGWS